MIRKVAAANNNFSGGEGHGSQMLLQTVEFWGRQSLAYFVFDERDAAINRRTASLLGD